MLHSSYILWQSEIENILVETKAVQEDALSPFAAAQIVLEHYFKK
jgi:hypothetical protein